MARNSLPELGQAIDDARRARGWSMDLLAERSGLSVNTIRSTVRGAPPNIVNLMAIADALETTVGRLLGEPAGTGVEATPEIADLLKAVGALRDDDIETLTNLARRLASERGRVELPQEVEEIAAQLSEPERRALARAIAQRDREDRLKVADESGQYDPDAGALRPPRQGSERARGGRVGES